MNVVVLAGTAATTRLARRAARAPDAPGARLVFPAVDEMRSIDVAYYLGISRQRVSLLASEQDFRDPVTAPMARGSGERT